MRKLQIIIAILAFVGTIQGQTKYSINISLKDGDFILYQLPGEEVKHATNGFGFSFIKEIMEPELSKGNNVMPLVWFDMGDTSTIKYYTKNGYNYVYELVDKSFGKNNAFQYVENRRPLYDKLTGRIFYPEGTCLDYQVKTSAGTLSGIIDKFTTNSIYFIQFIPKKRANNLSI